MTQTTQRPQRTVLLTGGARGIGAAIKAELAAAGHKIIAPPRAELDLASPASIEKWLVANGSLPVDILINNAGINTLAPIAAINPADWRQMLQVNLDATLALTQAFAPGMAARGWGRVLNLSTIFSIITKERRAMYSMTKAAVGALTRSTAVEFGPAGVLANALAPGFVDTALTHQNNTPGQIKALVAAIPLRRMATPAQLAKIAVFLISEDNAYITGQIIVADGGFTLH